MTRAAEPGTPKDEGYYAGANEDLLRLLPTTARVVLDVGCGEGALGRLLRASRPDVTVHGVDREARALEVAQAHLDRVWQHDLDEGLPALGGPYDAVLCGDVLEHLEDPWSALRALAGELVPGGCVVASLPNVRHYKVLRELVFRGRFTYRDKGILDATHLRFFTLREMRRLFACADLEIDAIRPRLGGRNLVARGLDLLMGGRYHEFRAVQFTLRGMRRRRA